jgi:hypothetical protein
VLTLGGDGDGTFETIKFVPRFGAFATPESANGTGIIFLTKKQKTFVH